MNRTLIGLGLVLLLVISLGVALMWYLALESTPVDSELVVSRGVRLPASVTFEAGAIIEAGSEVDAYYLLGYAHGREHAWTLNLLRQTALGRLSEWYGDPTVPIDRLSRSLAFSSGAVSAVQGLSSDDRSILAAYADGISDAFKTRTVALDEHLVLFDIIPEAWEPWHSIALERLFAWISEPPIVSSRDDTAHAALSEFQTVDETLREWLHLHGFEYSTVWAADDTAGAFVQAQLVYGATVSAILTPVEISWPNVSIDGVSLLGTPFFPVITGEAGTRVTLLSSSRRISNRFAAGFPDSLETDVRHERLVLASGREQLVSLHSRRGMLFFSDATLTTDSVGGPLWGTLRWNGLQSITDWPAWRRQFQIVAGLSAENDPSFQLIEGTGLLVNRSGRKTVSGRPNVLERRNGAVFIGIHPFRRYAAERFLDRLESESLEDASDDVTSSWAAATVGPALLAIEGDSTLQPVVREAIDYLRNWDFRYGLASIGALIFDAWMGEYAGPREPFPTITIPADSVSRVELTEALKQSLITTVDSLIRVAGPNLARWRLEAFRTSDRNFPVWSFGRLATNLPGVDPRRYAPLSIQRPGHPTTVAWESGLFDYPAVSPAHVVARAKMDERTSFSFRPDYHIGTGIIARHVAAAPESRPEPFPSGRDGAIINFRPTP